MDARLLQELTDCDPSMIVVGASAGAVDALKQILPALPASFRAPLLIVVHVPPDRDSAMTSVFAAQCRLAVAEADDKTVARAGCAYFAPPDYHLMVDADGTLVLSVDDPVHFSRPSVDVLFESAAYAFRERTLGILLSGASADGAEGLAQIRNRGGLTWVQEPSTASADTMPKAALERFAHPAIEPRHIGELLAAWSDARG